MITSLKKSRIRTASPQPWSPSSGRPRECLHQKAARYCALFASEDYAKKVWTTHERRSAQARALQSNQEYVLPVRFDNTEIPGLRPTVMYVDAGSLSPGKLAELISKKLGPRFRRNFFPPEPDKLFSALGAASPDERHAVERVTVSFMQTLMRMAVDERRMAAHIFAVGCPAELQDNIHISLDIVRRDLGIAPTALVERLRAMSFGFTAEIRSAEEHGIDVLVVRWVDLTAYEDDFTIDFADERATEVAVRMLNVGIGSVRIVVSSALSI